MCNEHRRAVALGEIATDFAQLRIPLRFPEGRPNLQALDSIRITDPTAIVRASAEEPGAAELVQRRWSWPGAHGKPVFNYRADGRAFGSGRCLIVADGFYEYTAPSSGKGRKDKWLFTMRNEPWFCIAGLWRSTRDVGEACTMLTVPPGPDIAPYHDRQVAVLGRAAWADWLDPAVPAAAVLKPSPAGTLAVTRA